MGLMGSISMIAPTNSLMAHVNGVHFYDCNIKMPYKLNTFYIDVFHYKKVKAFKIQRISHLLIVTHKDDNTVLT